MRGSPVGEGLRLRASAFGKELRDGECGLCAPVFGVLGLHLLPQLFSERERGFTVLARPLFTF